MLDVLYCAIPKQANELKLFSYAAFYDTCHIATLNPTKQSKTVYPRQYTDAYETRALSGPDSGPGPTQARSSEARARPGPVLCSNWESTGSDVGRPTAARLNRNGLSTHPCRIPIMTFLTVLSSCLTCTRKVGSLGQEGSNESYETTVQAELVQTGFNDSIGRSVKGTPDVQGHQHGHISLGLRILKGSIHIGYGVSCAAMRPEASLLLKKVLQFGRYPLYSS